MASLSTNHSFTNWAGTHSCHPTTMAHASSEKEILELLKQARNQHQTVRIVGAGHSPSDIVCTDGMMISLDRYNKLLSMDERGCTVTVEAGMRLKELNQHLDRHNLALSNLGSISEQSVGGAVATAIHGTGLTFGSFSSMILKIRLIDAHGTIHNLAANDADPAKFKAAQCSLGLLGEISCVQIQCEKKFKLEVERFGVSFETMLSQWEELVRSAEHVRFWWFPYSDNVLERKPKTSSWLKERLVGYHALELSLYLSKFFPSLVPSINRSFAPAISTPTTTSTTKREVSAVEESVDAFNFDCLFKQYVTEWAVEWSTAAPQALRMLKKAIEWDDSTHRKPRIRAHFPVEIRFMRGDDTWLSPGQGFDAVCYIGIIQYRPYGQDNLSPLPYWHEYETIMASLGGRPHWAKMHPLSNFTLSTLYPHFESFCQLRQSMDPQGRFLNTYARRHFSPTASPLASKL